MYTYEGLFYFISSAHNISEPGFEIVINSAEISYAAPSILKLKPFIQQMRN